MVPRAARSGIVTYPEDRGPDRRRFRSGCLFSFSFVCTANGAPKQSGSTSWITRGDSASVSPMTLNPRQIELLDFVRAHGSASVETLATHLQVTPQTVRRDVRLLVQARRLARFHGGAMAPGAATENTAYRQRQFENAAGKQAIARAVARELPAQCSLILNIGTTTEAVARELLHRPGLRVITNNLNVAGILCDNPQCDLIVAGGTVRAHDHGIVGEAAVGFVSQFRVDIAIIGISGIEADGALLDFDYREVQVSRAILGQARQVWLVADHSKFGRPAVVELGHLGQVDRVFTDAPPPSAFGAALARAGVQVTVCDPQALPS